MVWIWNTVSEGQVLSCFYVSEFKNSESNSEFIQSCILLHGSVTRGDFFFLSAVVLIQTLKYIHLKICISPFPPSGYERKELRSYLVCSFPQRWDLQYYAKHKFLKCWLSSWEARSGFKWQGVVSKSLFFPFGRYVLVFRQNVEKWSHLG